LLPCQNWTGKTGPSTGLLSPVTANKQFPVRQLEAPHPVRSTPICQQGLFPFFQHSGSHAAPSTLPAEEHITVQSPLDGQQPHQLACHNSTWTMCRYERSRSLCWLRLRSRNYGSNSHARQRVSAACSAPSPLRTVLVGLEPVNGDCTVDQGRAPSGRTHPPRPASEACTHFVTYRHHRRGLMRVPLFDKKKIPTVLDIHSSSFCTQFHFNILLQSIHLPCIFCTRPPQKPSFCKL